MQPMYRQPRKLKRKIFGENKVITEDYEVYSYHFIGNKPVYTFLYFIKPEN